MRIFYTTVESRDFSFVERQTEEGKPYYEAMLRGVPYQTTERFWDSIRAQFKIDVSLFDFWTPAEIMERVKATFPNKRIRFAFEETETGTKILGGSNKSYVMYENAVSVLMRSGAQFKYEDGRIYAHIPSRYAHDILKEENNGIEGGLIPYTYLELNIDGQGNNKLCTAFKIGDAFIAPYALPYFCLAPQKIAELFFGGQSIQMVPDFLTEPPKGVKLEHLVTAQSRYVTLAHRLIAAVNSAASLAHVKQYADFLLYQGVADCQNLAEAASENPLDLYELSSYMQVTELKRSKMPVKATMFHMLMRFAYAGGDTGVQGARKANRIITNLISDEYDFENVSFDDIMRQPLKAVNND